MSLHSFLARLTQEGKLHPLAIVEFLAQDVVARHIMVVDRAFFLMLGKGAPARSA